MTLQRTHSGEMWHSKNKTGLILIELLLCIVALQLYNWITFTGTVVVFYTYVLQLANHLKYMTYCTKFRYLSFTVFNSPTSQSGICAAFIISVHECHAWSTLLILQLHKLFRCKISGTFK
jgi:hypothetical protein